MTPPPETASIATQPDRPKPKLFYGWWMLVGAAVLSFVAALASLHEHSTFREAIEDSFFEADSLYRINTGLHYAYTSLGSLIVSFISGVVIAPIVGFVIDRHGPRPVMLIGVLVTGSVFLLITQVQNELQLQAALWLIRISIIAITSVVVLGTLGKWFVRKRVLAFAIVSACATFASMFSFDIIFAIREYGWQITVIVAGVTFLIVGIPVALMMRRQPEDHGLLPEGAAEHGNHHIRPCPKISATARSAVRIPAFWQLAIAVGLVLIAMSALQLDPRKTGLYDVRFLDMFRLGYLAIFFEIIGIVAIGFISLHLRKRILILASFASIAVAYSVLIVIYLVDSFPFEYLVFATFLVVSSVAKTAIVFLQFAILADYLGRRNFGTVVGIAIAANTVVSGLFHLSSSYLTFFAPDIAVFNLAQFSLGMIAIAIAAFLIIKLEPQARVAARIRHGNRAQSIPSIT